MITILVCLLVIFAVLILALLLTGIGIICWPLLLILIGGLIIDIMTIKKIFGRKKGA